MAAPFFMEKIMDKQVIIEAIAELENDEPTAENMQELANLYIVRDNIGNGYSYDAPEVLSSYAEYKEAKRKYQMHEGTEEGVLDCMHNVCTELQDLIILLYSNSDMRRERKQIQTMINKLYEIYSK